MNQEKRADLVFEGATVDSPHRKVPTWPLLSVHQTTLETVSAGTTRPECWQNMQLLNNRDIDSNMCCAAARQTLRTLLFRDQAPLGAQTTKRHTDQKWLGCQNVTKQHVQNTFEIFATYCNTKKQQLVTSPKHMPNSKPLLSIVFCNCFRTRGIDTNDGC